MHGCRVTYPLEKIPSNRLIGYGKIAEILVIQPANQSPIYAIKGVLVLSCERKFRLCGPAKDVGDTTKFDVETIRTTRARLQPVLTILSGLQAGKTIILEEEHITIGRDAKCDVVLIDSGISRKHACIEQSETGDVQLTDLGSTNGVRVNGDLVERHALLPGDKIQLGPETLIKYRVEDPDEVRVRIEQYDRSIRDDLTGIYNRRHFSASLERELGYVDRRGSSSNVVLLDIDHFKRVNDTYGHIEGDRILVGLAKTVSECIREEDIFARWGGEEFAIMLRNLSQERTFRAAERIRLKIAEMVFDCDGNRVSVTASLGISEVRQEEGLTSEEVLRIADERLYRAKKLGRNRTVND